MQIRYRLFPERVKAANKRWAAAHPEAMRKKWRKRYWKNPEKFKARTNSFRKRNPEKVKEWKQRWQKENKDAIRAKKQSYQKTHARRIKERKHSHYLRNKKSILAKTKAYQQAHPEMRLKYQQNWRKAHPAIVVAQAAQRRALKRTAALNYRALVAWMENVRSKATAVCYYCNQTIPSSNVHFDHIVPISKGGQHTPENLCVSCGPCNQSKGPKDIQAWVKMGQQILAL